MIGYWHHNDDRLSVCLSVTLCIMALRVGVGGCILWGMAMPVSLRSWSVQRARGRPGRRLQSLPSERPDASPTWQCRALCAGVPWVSRAMWPNI